MYFQVQPHQRGVMHWEKRPGFKVLEGGTWVEPPNGAGLWIVSPVEQPETLQVYFASDERHPFQESRNGYDQCRWEWDEGKQHFVGVSAKITLMNGPNSRRMERIRITGHKANPQLNGTYTYMGKKHNRRRVYEKDDGNYVISWTRKTKWSVRKNHKWEKPAEGVGIWHFSAKLKGKILCYFASNEQRPYDKSSEYDQVVWEWKGSDKTDADGNKGSGKWLKVYDWRIEEVKF